MTTLKDIEKKAIINGWYAIDGGDVFLYDKDPEYYEDYNCIKCLGDTWELMDFIKNILLEEEKK